MDAFIYQGRYMNKLVLLIGSLLLSSSAYSKSYFVKFKNQENLKEAGQYKSFSNEVLSFRQVETKIAPFAVIESALSEVELKEELNSNFFEVAYVESNDIDYKIISAPSDGRYSSQWGLNGNYGIKSEIAWNVQRGSKEVVVAVIDTGIEYSHPDLADNMWTNDAELNGEEGVDDDGNGVVDDIYGYNAFANNGNPMDGHSHGTHCAGVIGAVHNTQGIAGIMANVKLMAVKIFSDSGKTSVEAIVKGIEYAVANGAMVTSNSWGGAQKSQAIMDAIELADKEDVLFVAAAGNGNLWGRGFDIDKKPLYPAGYEFDNILSVGSITSSGRRSGFSNFGKKSVDIFAPGSDILSTVTNGGYKSMSGTSMATPHVSGVAGLVLSEFAGSTADEIKSKIMEGARKMDSFSDNSVSGGILDAPGALNL